MKKLGFGSLRLPMLADGSIDMDLYTKMIDRFLEKGFCYFDTAYEYGGGQAEPALRKALVERHPRDSFVLTTKISNEFLRNEQEQEDRFNEQLERLGVDYLDYYLIHHLGESTLDITRDLHTIEFLQKKKAEGKVKHIGFSFYDKPELLDKILTEHPEFDMVQMQINYLDWGNSSIPSRQCWEICRKHDKPIFVMEPSKGGILTFPPKEAEQILKIADPTRSNVAWALRFAASREGVQIVLSGMNAMDQLEDNMNTLADDVELSQMELNIMKGVGEIIKKTTKIPCTGCRYCTMGCPQQIPIPDYFALYKDGSPKAQAKYQEMIKTHTPASACLKCHTCESHCPQHIDIPSWMEVIADTFEGTGMSGARGLK